MLSGLSGMDLLQKAMQYHFGYAGEVFIAITLWLFSFSTFIGVMFYARSNVAYIFGDNWTSQTIYKVIGIINLFIGCLAAYTFVWDLGDLGIGLMTVFNMIALIPMSGKAVAALRDYETNWMKK
jgi:AGCS family alanine or glycine:cation symporter